MKANQKYFGKIRLFLLIIILSSFFFKTCTENPGEFTLGGEFIESQTDLNLIDTFSVNLSTVIIDSVETSNTGNLLVGSFRDDTFGKITSHSYFQIGIPDEFNVEDDDEYDSLNLIIKYNKYYFGDTTETQKISVHQLTENIEFEENKDVIVSKTSFDYNTEPIGSIVYSPKPFNTTDTLVFKISDIIGLDLFTKLRDNSEVMDDNERFINYFRGLALIADETYEGSIVGFNADEADVRLILYTNRVVLSKEEISHEFRLENPRKQYNNFMHDFSSTQFSSLVEQRNELPSSETGGLSFIHGGIGMVLRVDFPSFEEMLLFERGTIMEAQLSISPLKNSFNDSDLPSNLIIYDSDKINRRNNLLFNYDGNVVESSLIIDELYNEEDAYLFDITKFINDELADSYVDPEKGLLVTLPLATLEKRFDRLIVDANNQNTKLKIYYLSY